jgi:TatA/E family protein of Tat protein translocase
VGCVLLLLFGAKRIPSLARSLGSGLGEFRRGVSGHHDSEEMDEKVRFSEPARLQTSLAMLEVGEGHARHGHTQPFICPQSLFTTIM